MFRWVEGTTPEQIHSVSAGLDSLPGAIPEIAEYRHGVDAGFNKGNFDYAVVGDFATVDNYLIYRDHPVHKQLITDLLAPLIADRSAVQLHLD